MAVMDIYVKYLRCELYMVMLIDVMLPAKSDKTDIGISLILVFVANQVNLKLHYLRVAAFCT